MRSVASAPVGAPLAMSTLGPGARSLRAPATPSITGRPCTGSSAPGCWTGPATGRGLDQVLPPLGDVDISSKDCLLSDETVPTPNREALPSLSVRIVQPSGGFLLALLAAEPIWRSVHVSPPSVETATCSGAGAAATLRNDAQQT